MAEILNLYPTLTENGIENAGIMTNPTEFSYYVNYEHFPLVLDDKYGEPNNFTARLKDDLCVWYPETHNLIISKSGSINYPEKLFGTEGIAPHDAIIGIAGVWSTKKSDLHGTIHYTEFGQKQGLIQFEKDLTFDRSIISGSIKYQLVLYLKKSGVPYPEESHLANQTGTILGVIEQCEIYVDGNGSLFPILTVNEPGKPLWWVNYDNTADPFETPFEEEYVEICLNRAHPCFEDLKIEESLKKSPLFIEVITSALYIIVMSVIATADAEWELIKSGENLTSGTIAEAVSYFINKLEWDTTDPSSLAKSIHKYFDENL